MHYQLLLETGGPREDAYAVGSAAHRMVSRTREEHDRLVKGTQEPNALMLRALELWPADGEAGKKKKEKKVGSPATTATVEEIFRLLDRAEAVSHSAAAPQWAYRDMAGAIRRKGEDRQQLVGRPQSEVT